MLKHQAISNHSADYTPIHFQLFTERLLTGHMTLIQYKLIPNHFINKIVSLVRIILNKRLMEDQSVAFIIWKGSDWWLPLYRIHTRWFHVTVFCYQFDQRSPKHQIKCIIIIIIITVTSHEPHGAQVTGNSTVWWKPFSGWYININAPHYWSFVRRNPLVTSGSLLKKIQ